ncbi:hypothetical protein B0H13DRAFT_2334585 [Mycena leptocephala]|nr:hypothetical protein B0H13DRAFT_2334585 [Mycena leptocephala]
MLATQVALPDVPSSYSSIPVVSEHVVPMKNLRDSINVPATLDAEFVTAADGTDVEVAQSYHDNVVKMPFSASGGYQLVDATYTIDDFSITNGQDPDHKIQKGQQRPDPPNRSTFNHDPDALNFAFIGTLKLTLTGGVLGTQHETYILPNFGGKTCEYQSDKTNTIRCTGTSNTGFVWYFFFRRGGNGNPVDTIDLNTVTPSAFKPIKMQDQYIGEDTMVVWQEDYKRNCAPPYVTYYSPKQSETLRILVGQNRLWQQQMKKTGGQSVPLDTATADVMPHLGTPTAIFVVGLDGQLYVSLQHKVYMFHHSSILAGADVLSAGELKVNSGKITYASNWSGHYKPDAALAKLQLEEALRRLGYTDSIPWKAHTLEEMQCPYNPERAP